MIRRLSLPLVARALGDFVMPRTCVACGTILSLRENHVCLDCLAQLPRTYYWKMERNPMADRLNAMVQRDIEADPSSPYEPYFLAVALFFYQASTPYSRITQSLKYHRDIGAGKYFSDMLGEKLASSPLFEDVDTVVPVPLHWTRRWERGYNQAEVIAKELARKLGANLRTDILRRVRRTRTQTRLSVPEKEKNVRTAFVVTKGYADKIKGGRLSPPSHILLVDDVFTTGATTHACLKALRTVLKPSVTRISVATLAVVGP